MATQSLNETVDVIQCIMDFMDLRQQCNGSCFLLSHVWRQQCWLRVGRTPRYLEKALLYALKNDNVAVLERLRDTDSLDFAANNFLMFRRAARQNALHCVQYLLIPEKAVDQISARQFESLRDACHHEDTALLRFLLNAIPAALITTDRMTQLVNFAFYKKCHESLQLLLEECALRQLGPLSLVNFQMRGSQSVMRKHYARCIETMLFTQPPCWQHTQWQFVLAEKIFPRSRDYVLGLLDSLAGSNQEQNMYALRDTLLKLQWRAVLSNDTELFEKLFRVMSTLTQDYHYNDLYDPRWRCYILQVALNCNAKILCPLLDLFAQYIDFPKAVLDALCIAVRRDYVDVASALIERDVIGNIYDAYRVLVAASSRYSNGSNACASLLSQPSIRQHIIKYINGKFGGNGGLHLDRKLDKVLCYVRRTEFLTSLEQVSMDGLPYSLETVQLALRYVDDFKLESNIHNLLHTMVYLILSTESSSLLIEDAKKSLYGIHLDAQKRLFHTLIEKHTHTLSAANKEALLQVLEKYFKYFSTQYTYEQEFETKMRDKQKHAHEEMRTLLLTLQPYDEKKVEEQNMILESEGEWRARFLPGTSHCS